MSAAAGTGSGGRRQPLDPVVLSRVASLTLRARRVVEGALSGLHRSPHHGASIEFADHKDYSPGDEIRHIDWRLYGKSDKLYVKRFEHETNLRAYLLLDGSASMAYGERFGSKLEYARSLAAAIAYLLLEQRDAVGVASFRERLDGYIPPRSDRGHLQVLADALARVEPDGRASAARALDELAERIPRRGLVVLLSDGFEDLAVLGRALSRLHHRHHDIALLQVLDADEVEFPFDELTRFRSLEDEREVLAEPRLARASYLAALAAHGQALAAHCRAAQVDYHRFVTSEPLDRALVRFLGSRR
jgi:uncharacterized protein (DUF58 family)